MTTQRDWSARAQHERGQDIENLNEERRVETSTSAPEGNSAFANLKNTPLEPDEAERLGIGGNPDLGRETGREANMADAPEVDSIVDVNAD